jgi:glutaredoxin
MSEEEIEKQAQSAEVVIFRSPLSDLGGLDRLLDRRGVKWRSIELGMGERENRARFELLRQYTGHATLPQIFVGGRFVGGIAAARELFEDEAAVEGPSRVLSGSAAIAGYAGLVPFAGLAVWLWAHGGVTAGYVLDVYAATIVAFAGAVHWGWALAEHAEPHRYYLSVVPALAAWVCASLPPQAGMPLLAALVAGVWYAERRWFARNLPRWYLALRLQLSAVSVASLLAAWIAVLVR